MKPIASLKTITGHSMVIHATLNTTDSLMRHKFVLKKSI